MSLAHRKLNKRRWARVRRAVLDRAGWRCEACGAAARLEVDHVVPLQHDPGQDPYDLERLQALCRPCHFQKTAAERGRVESPDESAWSALVREMLRV